MARVDEKGNTAQTGAYQTRQPIDRNQAQLVLGAFVHPFERLPAKRAKEDARCRGLTG